MVEQGANNVINERCKMRMNVLKNNWRGEGARKGEWEGIKDKWKKKKKENRNKVRRDLRRKEGKKFHSDIILYKRIKEKKKKKYHELFAKLLRGHGINILLFLNIDVLEKRRKRKNVGELLFRLQAADCHYT